MKAHTKNIILNSLDGIGYLIKRIKTTLEEEDVPKKAVILIQNWPGYDVQVDGCPLGMHLTYGEADAIAESIAKTREKTDERGYARARVPTKEEL